MIDFSLRSLIHKLDNYFARTRVLERLNYLGNILPAGVTPRLGPDATGVGWVYEYALVDRTGHLDLGQLRALQDWFLKFELKSVANVAEVASLGGMVRQYQVVLDPNLLRSYGIPHAKVVDAIRRSNQETGALSLSWLRLSTWCAPRATLLAWRTSAISRSVRPRKVFLCAWVMWPASRLAPKCAAELPSWMARVK